MTENILNQTVSLEDTELSKNDNTEYPWDENELQEFRNAIKRENLVCRMDDIFLLSFLRARKYDRKRALEQLKNYYRTRRRFPEIFTDLNPSAVSHALDMKIIQLFPPREKGNPVIGIERFSHWDPDKLNATELIRCLLLFGDLELNDHPIQLYGVIYIFDTKTISWKHLIQHTPKIIYTLINIYLGSYPVRYKAIHVININKFVYTLLTLFLPFLPYKFKKRIHLHSNLESLHKEIDPKCLPADYGGKLPPMDPTEANERIRLHEEFYRESEKYWTINKEVS